MTRRLSTEGLEVEYRDATNYQRLSDEGLEVEYRDTVNYRRLSCVALGVEATWPEQHVNWGPRSQAV